MRNPVSQNPANRAFGGLFGDGIPGHSQLKEHLYLVSYPDMPLCMGRLFQAAAASFHIPQEYRDSPCTLVRISFKENNEADDEPLPFGQSYWDYLPDLVQTKIMKMVHKQLLKSVHAELLETSSCPNCKKYFDNPFELESHWSNYYYVEK